MPLSKDRAKRQAQLRNLRPVNSITHGASSEQKVAPVRAKHRTELLERYPGLDGHRLVLLADLLARCEVARDFIDVRGLMRNTREPHPVLHLLDRWERRAWAMLQDLQPRGRPPERVIELPNLHDREVQEAAHAFLRASMNAERRKRRSASTK